MPTIVVVDDDQQMRTWLRQILEDKGYHVQEARDGYEALASVERSEPALMVVDICLPKFSGLDIIMHLRSRHQSVKVLAISGQILNSYDIRQTAKAMGAHDTLAKPFGSEDFLQRVDALLVHP
ncbi:MAG: response regulator [Nitrospira sp.]